MYGVGQGPSFSTVLYFARAEDFRHGGSEMADDTSEVQAGATLNGGA